MVAAGGSAGLATALNRVKEASTALNVVAVSQVVGEIAGVS
jgi:hypothetical protein